MFSVQTCHNPPDPDGKDSDSTTIQAEVVTPTICMISPTPAQAMAAILRTVSILKPMLIYLLENIDKTMFINLCFFFLLNALCFEMTGVNYCYSAFGIKKTPENRLFSLNT